MASSDLVSALRTRRYTLQLCSYSQELFLAYLMEHKFMALLGIVNQHIELAVLSGKPSQQVQAVRLGTASEEVEMLNKKHVFWGQLKQPSAVEEALEDDGGAADEDADEDEEAAKAKRRAKRPKTTTIANGAPVDRVPLPPARGRELQMKIEQLKEIRKRVELSAAKLPSACLYSFFNATDRVHCLNMSEDATMIAAGFADSYIKIWSLDAKKPLRTLQPGSSLKAAVVTEDSKLEDFLDDQPEQSKTLIGHAGPVYETSFSPDNSHLVSCSEDGTVRLWNLATFTNVVCYKGHMNPVWSVSFSPLGYYFATASHDRTARLWSTDHIYPLRLFAGRCEINICTTLFQIENVLESALESVRASTKDGRSLCSVGADKQCPKREDCCSPLLLMCALRMTSLPSKAICRTWTWSSFIPTRTTLPPVPPTNRAGCGT